MKTNRLLDGLLPASAAVLLLAVSGCSTQQTTIVVDPVAKSPERYNKMFNRGSKGATLVVYVPTTVAEYVEDEDKAPTCAETINVDAPSYSVENCQGTKYGPHGDRIHMTDEPQPTPQPNHPGPHYIVVAFQAESTAGESNFRGAPRLKKLPLVIIRTTPDTTDKPNAVDADPGDEGASIYREGTPHKKARLILNFPGGFPEGEQGKPKIFRVRNTPVPPPAPH